MSTKRVFILGAGFSAQAGMPLSTELTGTLLDRFKEINHEEMLSWYKWLKQRIDWLKKTSGKISGGINIEQVFDLAHFDVEAWRMEQQRCSLGRQYGDTPWGQAERIQTWLTYMEDDLIDVIWEKQKNAREKLELVSMFSKNLRADDAALTFNYDTLLEESLTAQQKPWHYGFKKENGNGVLVLKMHGSINWVIVPRSQVDNFGYPVLFQKEDKNKKVDECAPMGESEYDYVLLRVPDDKLANRIENRDLQWANKTFYIGLAGLGSYKPLHKLPGSGEVWVNAMKDIRGAEEIYVIGFSLSPFDNMARLHFGGVMCERAEKSVPKPKVVLIDPNACELKARFTSVFGSDTPIQIYEQKADDIDWPKVLS